MPNKLIVLGLVLGLLSLIKALPCAADIYVYRDQVGGLYISNMKSDEPTYTLIKIRRDHHVNHHAYPTHAGSKVMYRAFPHTVSLRPVQLPGSLASIVRYASDAYQVDQALVHAMIHAESDFNPNAISHKGAVGLMQLMPETAQRYGVHDLFNPTENVIGGVHYMHDLLVMFGNDVRLALAAYNAGEDAVLRYGGIPPYPETISYVRTVLELHARYRASDS